MAAVTIRLRQQRPQPPAHPQIVKRPASAAHRLGRQRALRQALRQILRPQLRRLQTAEPLTAKREKGAGSCLSAFARGTFLAVSACLLPKLGRMRCCRPRSFLSLRSSVCPPPSDGFRARPAPSFRHETPDFGTSTCGDFRLCRLAPWTARQVAWNGTQVCSFVAANRLNVETSPSSGEEQ